MQPAQFGLDHAEVTKSLEDAIPVTGCVTPKLVVSEQIALAAA